MRSFRAALIKATGKRHNKIPKEKHISAMQAFYHEIEFPQIAELISKQLEDKKTPTRLRTLYVVHVFMNRNYQDIINWFHTTNLIFEKNPQCMLSPLIGPYYNYLKARCKSASSISFFLNPNNLPTIKENSHDLFSKTEEILNVMQALISSIENSHSLLKYKIESPYLSDICSAILSDSKSIYNALKSAIGAIWQMFENYEYFEANRANELFLRYNNLVLPLKIFSERCEDVYPGQKPTFSLLSESTMQQVNSVVKSKQNINTTKNLLSFENVNRDGSPVKRDTRRSNSPNIMNNTGNEPRGYPMQNMNVPPIQFVTGFPMYGMYPGGMMFPQQAYYQNYQK
ncbi:hypothetical protein SteCoe_8000 [Stentor coeruleus]|uniref:AP180 N-terminal homology (ANTH) domain-containing protein n=1 Tax=Stentor coeruleus TaxID=5963 RepID=A0A1R2CL90_9CILI|nr:hypothetical protein SteCoe_8000 [Stentor coeruleus]